MDVRLACHTNLDIPVSLSFTVSMLRQRSEASYLQYTRILTIQSCDLDLQPPDKVALS